MIKQIVFACSTDERRLYLLVFYEVEDQEITMISTDICRMALNGVIFR